MRQTRVFAPRRPSTVCSHLTVAHALSVPCRHSCRHVLAATDEKSGLTSCSSTHGMSLRFDAQHQILPGFGECLSTLSLELACQFAGVNAAAGETLQRGLAVTAIDGSEGTCGTNLL